MSNKYFFVESVLFLLLFQVSWNIPAVVHQPCPWEKSKIVQHIINKKFIPILERYRISVPLDCPFHPNRDVFKWPEDNDDTEWKCPICGEKFHCEQLLATHWDGSHSTRQNCHKETGEDSVCLADYCDIMRCEVMSIKMKEKRLRNLNQEPIKQDKPPCDESQLSALQNRCQGVIRQCIVGLLATVSLKDFRDIEDDLNEAICSYLTCDLYWHDFNHEVRQIPVYFCFLILVIIVGGFWLCYYVVWILFEYPIKPETSCNGFEYNSTLGCYKAPSYPTHYHYTYPPTKPMAPYRPHSVKN